MRGSIIVFSGMDGAGKSTQIDLLDAHLIQDGQSTRRLWSRGGYTAGMNRLKSLLRRSTGDRAIPAAGPGEARTRAFSRRWVRRIWLSLAILDLILIYGVWLRLQRWVGRATICDRYLADTKIDFSLNFPTEPVANWWLWKLLTWVTPKPDASFLLLISVRESQHRSVWKQEPFPDSAETLAQRLAEYESWSDDWKRLDGQDPIQEIADEIYQEVTGWKIPSRQTVVSS